MTADIYKCMCLYTVVMPSIGICVTGLEIGYGID